MFTILHNEESELIKQMVKAQLDGYGANYIPVGSTSEAYEIIGKTKVDLIVTSSYLKNDSIEVFIKNISNSINKDTPVFLVTGRELGDESKGILNLGVSDYILKDHLASEISKHIDVLIQQEELLEDLRNAKIAIIDDSSLDRHLTKDILCKYGVEKIDCYKSGNEIRESGKQYNVYIVDAVLKEEYGNNLIMHLRRKNPNSSIIVVSSLNNPKTIAGLLNSGANDFIQKPIDESLFLAKLKSNMRIYNIIKKSEL